MDLLVQVGEFVPVFLNFHIPRVDGPIDDGGV